MRIRWTWVTGAASGVLILSGLYQEWASLDCWAYRCPRGLLSIFGGGLGLLVSVACSSWRAFLVTGVTVALAGLLGATALRRVHLDNPDPLRWIAEGAILCAWDEFRGQWLARRDFDRESPILFSTGDCDLFLPGIAYPRDGAAIDSCQITLFREADSLYPECREGWAIRSLETPPDLPRDTDEITCLDAEGAEIRWSVEIQPRGCIVDCRYNGYNRRALDTLLDS